MTINQRDKKRLRHLAQLVHDLMQSQDGAENIRWRPRLSCEPTWAEGWFVKLGSLRRNQPRLEMWLDRWPHRSARDFYFGFFSRHRHAIQRLIKRVPPHLSPVSELSTEDYEQKRPGAYHLTEPLKRRDFNRPIYEHYYTTYFFFGVYDRTPSVTVSADRLAARRASTFFLEVLRSLPPSPTRTQAPGIYPRSENRLVVVSHLARERDATLPEACKIRDNYTCQVCGLRFEDLYGELGHEFAEAHHIIPLSRLKGEVMTTRDDLIAVCANCHRMLHQMDGKSGDIPRLRSIVRRHRKRQ